MKTLRYDWNIHSLLVGQRLAGIAGIFIGLVLVCVGIHCYGSTESAKTNLQAVLHKRPSLGSHQLFDAGQITNAILAFGKDRAAAFPVLMKAGDETNGWLIQSSRPLDTNTFVRAGALFGMGQLGKSVPEVQPFLWAVVQSPLRDTIDRYTAFQSLRTIGFEPRDIPVLAQLLSGSACDQNILTLLVPEAISGLIETNPSAVKPYLGFIENLLGNSNPDTQFRAALALVKSEGADSPSIFSALHALFQRPNDHHGEYYKTIAAQILAKAGPSAKPLVPDMLEFARLPDEDSVYQLIAQIAPELDSKIPEVAQALKELKQEKRWAEKWSSGEYSLDDLRAALMDPNQTLTAAKLLAERGAKAKAAVPEMIRAMWGRDETTRNTILADVHKIDPQVTVAKIDLVKENQDQPVYIGLQFAYSELRKMPVSPQINVLRDACFEMFFSESWVLPDELLALTNSLAKRAPTAYQAYLDGLKPPVCSKPADSNAVISTPGVQLNYKIK